MISGCRPSTARGCKALHRPAALSMRRCADFGMFADCLRKGREAARSADRDRLLGGRGLVERTSCVRLEPKSGSPALATLKNGEIIRNLGCKRVGNTRWCRIRSITGIDVAGWVSGTYLRESRGPVEIQPPAGGGGPSGIYVVSGLASGDTLNVRTRPSTQGDVIAQLSRGAKVQNLGCEQSRTDALVPDQDARRRLGHGMGERALPAKGVRRRAASPPVRLRIRRHVVNARRSPRA